MSAAWISASILAVLLFSATAEPPMNVVGEGLLSKPFSMNGSPGKGVRYTGPVVYSNEKPPIIYFPPPPKDAKPGLGLFGKNKPKSIKYVPMPHHDLPVLIYTSDKMPPIHVVQPSKIEGPLPFGSPTEEFRPPAGSLSSAYRGILPEATSARIVTSSYEIPSTSYGTPVKALGSSIGSLDLSPTGSIKVENSEHKFEHTESAGFRPAAPPVTEPISNYQRPGFGPIRSYNNVAPDILYSGQPPVHFFNEPDMFVQAPREIPVKTYADMPPKASFGPPKTSFGPPSINTFGPPPLHHHPHPPLASFGPTSYLPPRENLIPSPSSLNPSAIVPSPNDTPKAESNQVPVSQASHAPTQSQGGPPPNYQFSPPQTMFSFGPFSIEYGPPSEPFMSFSEPTGSLSSFYGAKNDVPSIASNSNINVVEQENWIPGPPPTMLKEQPQQEVWDAPMPPPLPSYRPHLRSPTSFHGPRPNLMHSSVLLPSGPPKSVFGGYSLAHLLSAFKLKRSKPKYAIAPKSMQKPPIIIYYGKKPPIHVYQKPDEEYSVEGSAAYPSTATFISQEASSSDVKGVSNGNSGVTDSRNTVTTTSADNVDLTYGGSQKTEIRVAAPPAPVVLEKVEEKPVIIPAKPVDIFPSAELQPSVYMARNSLNTILVSDLAGSENIKTYIVRNSDDSQDSAARFSVGRQGDTGIMGNDHKNNGRSIPIADREQNFQRLFADQIYNASVLVSEEERMEETEDNGDSSGSSNHDMRPTIVLAVGTPKQETEELQSQASEPTMTVIQSPSSFQTSLSQAEKDAEEAVETSSL